MSLQTVLAEMTAAKPQTHSRIRTSVRMSNRQYHAAGKPRWWVRVPNTGSFYAIDDVRGDDYLDVEVPVPPGTTLEAGCGPNNKHGMRVTLQTAPLA